MLRGENGSKIRELVDLCTLLSFPDHPELYAQVPAETSHRQGRRKQRVWIEEHCLLHSRVSRDSLHLCNFLSKSQGMTSLNNVLGVKIILHDSPQIAFSMYF